MADQVRKRRPGCSTITSKHQVTIPAAAFAAAGLCVGESLRGTAVGPGQVLLTRESDPIADTAGIFDGVYPPDAVEALRDEWD